MDDGALALAVADGDAVPVAEADGLADVVPLADADAAGAPALGAVAPELGFFVGLEVGVLDGVGLELGCDVVRLAGATPG